VVIIVEPAKDVPERFVDLHVLILAVAFPWSDDCDATYPAKILEQISVAGQGS